jgi:hypothetical protein
MKKLLSAWILVSGVLFMSNSAFAEVNAAGSVLPPSGNWVFCGNEGDTCSYAGTAQVAYGAGSSFNFITFIGGTPCSNAVFGDPDSGVAKMCYYLSGAKVAAPTPGPAAASVAPAAQAATVAALRMAGTITGGMMPNSAPEFAKMVNYIQSGDYYDAAQTAVQSTYFPSYFVRRFAKQMMNPAISDVGIPDNDATTFIVANLIGSGTTANISQLWSDNSTYMINVAGTPTHAMKLSAAQLLAVDWKTDLVRVAGQMAVDQNNNPIAIPPKHVGGYLTLSSQAGDGSVAAYGLTAGTNLRAIEGIYEITMGLTLPELVVMDGAKAQLVPRFVPETNANFFVGQGQPACLTCHGGGASSLNHGYATMADVFDFDPNNGLTYIAAPTTGSMKSLGSTPNNRANTLTCNLAKFTVCNPDSYGADTQQTWDLSTWQAGGLLSTMGWKGAITGEGLNALGAAVGQASLVYNFLVQRVIGEICPLGDIGSAQRASIASQAQAQDSFGYIVAQVASDPSCR